MQRILSIVFLLFVTAALRAQPDSSFHLYLLIGQSNMAGRGEISLSYQSIQYSNIFVLNKENNWVPAKHPLHFDKPKVAGVGPGMAFAISMSEAAPGVKIGLVPCAVGGTSIQVWVPAGYDNATKTHPYDDALVRIKQAMKAGVFKGVIWHQGEADSNPKSATEYLRNLEALVARLRSEIGNNSLPFVAGELGNFRPQYQIINDQLQKLPDVVKNSALATSQNLTHKGDTTHFDSRSADELGRRMAEKMKVLQSSRF